MYTGKFLTVLRMAILAIIINDKPEMSPKESEELTDVVTTEVLKELDSNKKNTINVESKDGNIKFTIKVQRTSEELDNTYVGRITKRIGKINSLSVIAPGKARLAKSQYESFIDSIIENFS